MLGSSTVRFTETGPETALPALVRAELVARVPQVNWQCESGLLFPGAAMASRLMDLQERHQPDAVMLWLTSIPFAEDYPMFAVRDRWPRAYPALNKLADSLRRAGRITAGTPGLRSGLFYTPQKVLARTIGAAPETPLEVGIASTCESLAELARAENVAVLCRLATPIPVQPGWLAENERRTAIYNKAVVAECARYRLLYYDPSERARAAAFPHRLGPDGFHSDAPSRRFNAAIIAELLAGAMRP